VLGSWPPDVTSFARPAIQVAGHGWWGVLAVVVCVLLALGANAIFVGNVQARRLNAMGAVALGLIVTVLLVALG
jgi:hypothetical protein